MVRLSNILYYRYTEYQYAYRVHKEGLADLLINAIETKPDSSKNT